LTRLKAMVLMDIFAYTLETVGYTAIE
jgi:hypothetical protein